MASLGQVEWALVSLINSALYPSGSAPSAVGYPVKIYAGWPNPQTLDADLIETAGAPAAAHVSVFPLPTERNVTRFPAGREQLSVPDVTYTLTAAGQVITVGGVAPSTYFAQNLAAFVNGKPYVVQAAAGQTAAQVAAALLTAIQVDVPGATISGAAITLPSSARIGALRVGSTGSTIREVRRQERQFQISVWAPSPNSRAAVADAFDPIMADTPRITLGDGSVARLRYLGTREDDMQQKARIYRRSLIYVVEYATTITEAAAQLVASQVDTAAADATTLATTYS